MDIRNFTGFVAAAELMNFTQAAQRLNLTQSALSRQIRSLEDYLGVKLFEKSGRNVRLTARGEALYAKINDVLIADRTLRSFAEELAEGEAGVLRIGACSQLIERYLPSFLKGWQAENPGIDIRLEDGGGPELAEKLRDGTVQMTLSAAPSTPIEMFEAIGLGHLGFLAVAVPGFFEGHGGTVELCDLMSAPILTLNKRHVSREVFDAACRLTGAMPTIMLESTSPHTLFAMAAGGNGIAVVPSSARLLPGSGLVAREITLRGNPVHFDICAMWNTRSPLPSYGRRFVEAFRDHVVAEETGSSLPSRPRKVPLQVV